MMIAYILFVSTNNQNEQAKTYRLYVRIYNEQRGEIHAILKGENYADCAPIWSTKARYLIKTDQLYQYKP